VLVELVLVVVV
jgi:hypothetical protein